MQNGIHHEVADDGSVYESSIDDKGAILPLLDGILERVKELKNIRLREDDILVCSFPRSGSHWVSNIVEILRHKQQNKCEEEWIPTNKLIEKFESAISENASSPQVLTTHLTPDYLPPDLATGKVKLIYVTREPKDIIVSVFHFLTKLGRYEGSVRGIADLFLRGKLAYGDWLDHVQAYVKLMNCEDNARFLKLSYEQMKREPESHVKRIADFMGVPVTDDDIQSIIELSSISNILNKFNKMCGENAKIFYRKGECGDWKNHFTVATNEWFDDEFAKYLAKHGE